MFFFGIGIYFEWEVLSKNSFEFEMKNIMFFIAIFGFFFSFYNLVLLFKNSKSILLSINILFIGNLLLTFFSIWRTYNIVGKLPEEKFSYIFIVVNFCFLLFSHLSQKENQDIENIESIGEH
jgi:hypothetical protein